jgi:hypothetical protein
MPGQGIEHQERLGDSFVSSHPKSKPRPRTPNRRTRQSPPPQNDRDNVRPISFFAAPKARVELGEHLAGVAIEGLHYAKTGVIQQD